MNKKWTYAPLLVLAVVAVLIVTACGSGSDSNAEGSAQGASSAAQTVSVDTIDGVGKVLVDANGSALYAADQEADGMVVCTGSCTTIWDPLTVARGRPTAANGLSGKLGVLQRPDSSRQVTFDGRPLYRFMEDPGPGTVTGNGFADTFEDQSFIWHVATPTGVSTSNANSSSPGNGYGP